MKVAVLLFPAALGLTIAAGATRGGGADFQPKTTTSPFGGGCDTLCEICDDDSGHDNGIVNPSGATNTGTIHGCGQGSTCNFHNGCQNPEFAAQIASLSEAIQSDETMVIRRILKSDPAIRMNEARAAIQVYGCDGRVLAHMPVSGPQLAMLTE